MKFIIRHEIRGRIRIHLCQERMTLRQADVLAYYLSGLDSVTSAKVYERTADAVICYQGSRTQLIEGIRRFSYGDEKLEELVPLNSGRELNREYKERLIGKVLFRVARKLFLPEPVRAGITAGKALKYLFRGAKCLWRRRLEVEVLDATAITVSLLRRDFNTASSVMFLLSLGELLEEWTHKKSVGDLA